MKFNDVIRIEAAKRGISNPKHLHDALSKKIDISEFIVRQCWKGCRSSKIGNVEVIMNYFGKSLKAGTKKC